MQWKIENIILIMKIIVVKNLEINQILTLNNPEGVDLPLNNQTKPN